MKKILKITGMTLLALTILAFGAFYTWSRFTYGPSAALKKQVNIEQVEHKNDVYTFNISKKRYWYYSLSRGKGGTNCVHLYWE
ncbi:hypothetical protein [Bacillus pumilus]|uniref:hypothetical protein n=1 Tax=Bacillus pumilus TaxID=1408 RepID=UPI002491D9A5|nr:hypothetical protein [Bacillus pumilus]